MHLIVEHYLVGGLDHEFYDFPNILGMSSSQLTFIFFIGVGSPHQPDEHLVIFGFASKALEVHVDLGRPRPTASVPNLESDRSDHLSRGHSEQPTTTI
jgi:hypothetical protein